MPCRPIPLFRNALAMGNKLVAVPYDQLHLEMDKDQTKITMPGANKMP